MLTVDDIRAFQSPLPLADHEAREKGTNRDKTKKQYLVYINQEGVIPLLNSIDPDWSWDIQNIHFEPAYVSVTGRLTVKGVSRDGVGGNSPNGSSAPVDEDTVKGAETDALKRAALRFGVGLYLRSAPTFWIDASLPPWEGAKAALDQFAVWYRKEFATQSAKAPPPTGEPTKSPAQPSASVRGAGLPPAAKPTENAREAGAPKQENTDMRQRPDETEVVPNLYHADRLIISKSRTAMQYFLGFANSINGIPLVDMTPLIGLDINGVKVVELGVGTHKLVPSWSVYAEREPNGAWVIERIDAGVPETA